MQHARRSVPRKRDFAGEGLVQSDAQGVDVGAGVDGIGLTNLFGAHVGGRAGHLAVARQVAALAEAGQSEIAESGAEAGRAGFVGLQEDVARLDIAVDQAGRVGGRQGLRDRGQQRDRLAGAQSLPRSNVAAQRRPGHILHHEVGQVGAVAHDRVDADGVGVAKTGGRSRLAQETLSRHLVCQFRPQYLDRDVALELVVVGQKDDAHAAAPQFGQDAVRPECPRILERSRCLRGGTPSRM